MPNRLAAAAPSCREARVRRNRGIQQPRKLAALRAHSQRLQSVAGAISRKGRAIVELPDDVGACVPRHTQIRNAVGSGMARAATLADPFTIEWAPAHWASQQVQELPQHQKIE